MKVRLRGTSAEVAAAAAAIATVLDVVEVSGPYRDRGAGRLVRAYLDVQITEPPIEGAEMTKKLTSAGGEGGTKNLTDAGGEGGRR